MNNDELLEKLKQLTERVEHKKAIQEEREEQTIDNRILTRQDKDEEIKERIKEIKYLRDEAESLEYNFKELEEGMNTFTDFAESLICSFQGTLTELEIDMNNYFFDE